MRITAIRETAAPISSQIANAYIDFSKMTCSLVAVTTDVIRDGRPVTGSGFRPERPLRRAGGSMRPDRMIPRLMEAEPKSLLDPDSGLDRSLPLLGPDDGQREARRPWRALGRRGHARHGHLGRAGQDRGRALWRLPPTATRAAPPTTWSGSTPPAATTIQGKGVDGLVDEVKSYRDMGYFDFKLKIGGAPLAEDMKRIEAVIGVAGSGAHVAVDANGRFDRDTAIAYAEALEPSGPPLAAEEAGDPLDYALQAGLAPHYANPMATGENLFSTIDATNLIRYGGMRPDRDWLQFDCALSYGLCEYTRTLAMLEANGWSSRRVVPHGGHQVSLNIAAGLTPAATRAIPASSSPSAASRTVSGSRGAGSSSRRRRASASRPRPGSTPSAGSSPPAELRLDPQPPAGGMHWMAICWPVRSVGPVVVAISGVWSPPCPGYDSR
ncbi:MAG: enolase C-terminal domain-like protein [Geminicoccaceae bacterium]